MRDMAERTLVDRMAKYLTGNLRLISLHIVTDRRIFPDDVTQSDCSRKHGARHERLTHSVLILTMPGSTTVPLT